MRKNITFLCLLLLLTPVLCFSSEFAPQVPDLVLPEEEVEAPVEKVAPKKEAVKPVQKEKKATSTAKKKTATAKKTVAATKTDDWGDKLKSTEAEIKATEEKIKKLQEEKKAPIPPAKPVATNAKQESQETQDVKAGDAKEGADEEAKIVFNPKTDRDPTLSPDDTLLLKYREEQRLKAIEAERQRKIDEERKRLAELERQRQLELERLKDPSKEIRGRIRVNGIIGKEVFIGSKIYTEGSTVLGARIVEVLPDSVIFVYKGQRFTKKVQLQ